MKKRIVSTLMALLMCLSMLPMGLYRRWRTVATAAITAAAAGTAIHILKNKKK